MPICSNKVAANSGFQVSLQTQETFFVTSLPVFSPFRERGEILLALSDKLGEISANGCSKKTCLEEEIR
jgi:hypothetical protein